MTFTTSSENKKRMRRTFSQGASIILVTDNGPNFVSKELDNRLSVIGCRHMRTPSCHLRSNGIAAEGFVRTLKDHEGCWNSNRISSNSNRPLLTVV